jgi:hypothetical protein
MYLIRNTFKTKPGMAKDLVAKFKKTIPFMVEDGFNSPKILTDVVSEYWTVILEMEVKSLDQFENSSGFTSKPEVKEIMKDYMNLILSGHREIFKIE